MEFSAQFGMPIPQQNAVERDSSDPFHILVLSDLGTKKPSDSPIRIDRDDFDDVFTRLDVKLTLALEPGAPEFEISFSELDDFHPDNLFERLPLFETLRTQRRRLKNNATFAEESAAILSAAGTPNSAPSQDDSTPPDPNVDTGDLLNMAVAEAQSRQKSFVEQIAEGQLNIDDYIRQIVGPFVVAKSDPRQEEFVAGIDEAIAATMRRILHHPKYQQLEAAWLGVRMLIRRIETDAKLKISVLSLSKQQLANDLSTGDDLSQTRLYKHLVTSVDVPGAAPWSVVIGDYVFSEEEADVLTLGQLAQIHQAGSTVMIAAASPTIMGCQDLFATPDANDWQPADEATQLWQQLRSLASTQHVSLLLPRILARQPYGVKSSPIDAFAFEELPDGRSHNDYLWMNSAFGAAVLLGNAFSRTGWDIPSSISTDVDRLDIYVYKDGGESQIKPCAEVELSVSTETVFAQFGLSATYSVRGSDSVKIPAIRSLFVGDSSLAAAWN